MGIRRRDFAMGALAGLANLAAAQTQDRILPKSFAQTIRLTWKQDGRAVDVEVSNPEGNWVLTELLLELHYKPIERSSDSNFRIDKNGVIRPGKAKRTPGEANYNYEAIDGLLTQVQPTQHRLKLLVQPGTRRAAVVEAASDLQLTVVLVAEARGRRQSALERLRGFVR